MAGKLKYQLKRAISILKALPDRSETRIFCISMQRTGTTSVGKFFQDFGYRWAGWPADLNNSWSECWYQGDFEKIFSSVDFRAANAFEDSPWFLPGFYKVLYHRFPQAKFILFTRDADAWFQSMVNHSAGNIIGSSKIHCKIYQREDEYFQLLNSGSFDEKLENQNYSEKTLKLTGLGEHYKNIFRLHNREVQDFFNKYNSQALFVGALEDDKKWQKLGAFLGINVPENYNSYENQSSQD